MITEPVIYYTTDSFACVTRGVVSRGLGTGQMHPLCGPLS